MATARSIITAALRKLGVLASGENPRADEANDALLALNGMLASWGTSQLLVPRVAQEELVVSTQAVTLTTRPMRVLDSTALDGTLSYPIVSVLRDDWFAIADVARTGRPSVLWWDEKLSPLTVYFWPVPDKAYTVTLQRWDPLSAFDTLDSVMDLPAEYERAILFNLAVEVAPEFGVAVSAAVASIANVSLSALARYHSRDVPTMTTDLVGSVRRYSTDWRAW